MRSTGTFLRGLSGLVAILSIALLVCDVATAQSQSRQSEIDRLRRAGQQQRQRDLRAPSSGFQRRTPGGTTGSAGGYRSPQQSGGSTTTPRQTAAHRVVRLEVASVERSSLTAQQEWAEILSNVGADAVRLRSAGAFDEPKAEESQFGDTVSITLIGLINDRELALPGASFRPTETAAIADYIKRLKDDGADVALSEKLAFGLTSTQLVSVNEIMQAEVEIETKGRSAGEVVSQLITTIPGIVIDRQAQNMLGGSATVVEEMKGMSRGTALAAILRPLGLVLAPHRPRGGEIEIRIVDSTTVNESWPIGWPTSEVSSVLEPKLGERIENVEIRGVPLKTTLDALQKRIGIPFLYDHNSMARAGLDMNEVPVELVRDRVTHSSAVTYLLSQSDPQLGKEIRIDENGKPFVWISLLR